MYWTNLTIVALIAVALFLYFGKEEHIAMTKIPVQYVKIIAIALVVIAVAVYFEIHKKVLSYVM